MVQVRSMRRLPCTPHPQPLPKLLHHTCYSTCMQLMQPTCSTDSGCMLPAAQGGPASLFDPSNVTGGTNAVLQICWDVFQVRPHA